MAKKDKTGAPALVPRDETFDSVAAYAVEAARRSSTADAKAQMPEEEELLWVQGPDGHLRREQVRRIVPALFLRRLEKLQPDLLKAAVDALHRDPVFSEWLGALIGTEQGRVAISAEDIVLKCTLAQFDDAGVAAPDPLRVRNRLAEIASFYTGTSVAATVVMPIPGLAVQGAEGVQLADNLYVGKLTRAEFELCANHELVVPPWAGNPLIDHSNGYGARVTLPVRIVKQKQGHEITASTFNFSKSRRFGDWSVRDLGAIVEDVLFALRLAGLAAATSGGAIVEAPHFIGSFRSAAHRHTNRRIYHMPSVIAPEAVEPLRELWTALTAPGKTVPQMACRRFNAALDGQDLDDAVADLTISAEALFLSDNDKGELGYRLRVRAAKLLEEDGIPYRDSMPIFRTAYDLRSTVVHGGTLPEKVTLQGVELTVSDFFYRAAEMMRRALLLAVKRYRSVSDFGTAQYWDRRMFEAGTATGAD